MRFFLFPLVMFCLVACATKGKVNQKYSSFNGTFTCPAYKDGSPEKGVDFNEMTFTQEIKEVNGVQVMVSQTISGDVRPSNEKPSLNIIDGQWHIKDFIPRKGEMSSKKVFVKFIGPKKIHWISKMPAYTTDKGIKRPASEGNGFMWLDEKGNMNYTATNYKGQITCPRTMAGIQ